MQFCTSVWASFHPYLHLKQDVSEEGLKKKKKKKTFHCIRLEHFEMGVLGTDLLCNNGKKNSTVVQQGCFICSLCFGPFTLSLCYILYSQWSQQEAAAAISPCALSPCRVLPSIGKNTSPCAGGERGVPSSDNRWRPVSDDCLVMICDTVLVLVCGDPPRNTGFSWPRASLHTQTRSIASVKALNFASNIAIKVKRAERARTHAVTIFLILLHAASQSWLCKQRGLF